MKVMVVGSGGREHTLCWRLKQSPEVERLYCAPGNAGTAAIARNIGLEIGKDYPGRLADLAASEGIDLTIVGPEAPLADGIVDYFNECGLKIFGPTRSAAQLESSKVFAKEFMARHHIPTARFEVFDGYSQAREYLRGVAMPVVVKADGLAQGKGVFVCQTQEEADLVLNRILVGRSLGMAGDRVIIEECLNGEEVTLLAFTDGEDYLAMASSQDHKRVYENDEGPNTGGMGAYSPAPVVTPELQSEIEERILGPTIRGLCKEDYRFVGVIYLGLMITEDGHKVLEYNVRFGDPEAQVVLPRLKTDLVSVIEACLEGRLHQVTLEWDRRVTICVVLAAGGYPGVYERDKVIKGLDEVARCEDVLVFHAGTRCCGDQVLTNGGRVLGVTAFGKDIKEAQDLVYQAVEKISFEGVHFRRDIGNKALLRR